MRANTVRRVRRVEGFMTERSRLGSRSETDNSEVAIGKFSAA